MGDQQFYIPVVVAYSFVSKENMNKNFISKDNIVSIPPF